MSLKQNLSKPSCFTGIQFSRHLSLILLAVCIFSIGIFLGCGPQSDLDKAASIICAQVNGKKISLADFNQELQRLNLDTERTYMESEGQARSLRKELLLLMIDKELMIQEAKAKGITIEPDDLEVSLNEISNGYPSGKFSVEDHLTDPAYENWRSFFLEGLLVQRLIQQEIEPTIQVDEEEMRSFFLSHMQDFTRDKEFRARQIVVESEMEAREILKLLKKGHDFAKLAKERSLSPDREVGGDLGFFAIGQMPPEFDETVLRLKKGEISDVVQSDYGYHIFQLIEIRQPKKATWEDAKPKIKQILLARKRDKSFHDWLLDLRSRARIKINSKALTESY